MKKALAIILCIMFLMAICANLVSGAVVGDDPKNQVKIAKGTAVIDGIMDDCYTAADKITTPYPNGALEGENHATFEAYMVYDSDALYIWGHVSDPTLSANSQSWNGDGIEFFFNYELEDGLGAVEETDPYGEIGVMQFRAIPIPVEDQAELEFGGVYEMVEERGYDGEVINDLRKNPGNYYIKVDDDKKGYVIEFRFPYPTAKKASVKSGYAIGFSIQINDAMDGSPTEDARRTGTVHSQDGDELLESCWQYTGAFGRAFFTDLEYIAPVVDEPAPVVDDTPADVPAPAPAPNTGDSAIMLVVLVAALAGAAVITKRVRNKA
ncbi:MAG: hypothetical protein FWF92_02835 [Oscillospiraceae bacterium]|nr:hypothetical protein [Oscillospiraceae bacterium]